MLYVCNTVLFEFSSHFVNKFFVERLTYRRWEVNKMIAPQFSWVLYWVEETIIVYYTEILNF